MERIPRRPTPEPRVLPEVRERIRANLRATRLRLRLTQEKAAERCEVTYNQYREVEAGRATISIRTLCCLAEGLEVDPMDLLRPLPPD